MDKKDKVSINIDDFIKLREELRTDPDLVLAQCIKDRMEESMKIFDESLDNSLSLLENTDISVGYNFMKREDHYQYSKKVYRISGNSLIRLNSTMRTVKAMKRLIDK